MIIICFCVIWHWYGVRTYVSEPPHHTLIACLSTGEESDNICVISTWWRAPREPVQEMIWVELSTINRLITTGWFSPSKPSPYRLIQIHPLWGHSCPRQSNRTTPNPPKSRNTSLCFYSAQWLGDMKGTVALVLFSATLSEPDGWVGLQQYV